MTKFDLSQIKPIPGFDSQKWLRKRHAEMQRETVGMTKEQIRERELRTVEEDERWREELTKAESAEN
jgi:hypothetical protein